MTKRFGGVTALNGASLTISGPGVVHTLMGQNGSGKSTMMGLISGQLRPDAGQLLVRGAAVDLHSPVVAIRHRIAMVSQETALADDLTVGENVLMGRLVRSRSGVSWSASHRRAREALAFLELDYPTDMPVCALRPDQRQMVEIARAISLDASLLILDEPTSSLTDDEVGHLFTAIRRLTARGVAVLFVSHRLGEVFDISTEITVMRDGKTVSEGPVEHYDPASLVRDMVGEDIKRTPVASANRATAPAGQAALTVDGLSAGIAREVSLTVGGGQIIGLAGLEGSGRSDVLRAVFGACPYSGSISVAGEAASDRQGTRRRISDRVGYLPPDRKTEGVVLSMPVGHNLTMVHTSDQRRLRGVAHSTEQTIASRISSLTRLKAKSSAVAVSTLSGGNQQKVALGKWLAIEPKVLLLDEPTRGVDVAAKRDIHDLLRTAAANGTAILVTSSDTPELLELCDEILVMYRGQIVRRLQGSDLTESAVAHAAGGN